MRGSESMEFDPSASLLSVDFETQRPGADSKHEKKSTQRTMSDFMNDIQRRESIASVIGEVEVMDEARKQRIREMTKKKLAVLNNQNLAQQSSYFGETQHKFMKTTNEQGGVVEDDDDDPQVRKTMFAAMQEATSLFNCRCCPCLRAPEEEVDIEFGEDEDKPREATKVRKTKVMPNSNMDTWLKYIIMNLNEMDDI
jgi:hypothetical protein